MRDAFAVFDAEGFVGQVHQDHLDFAAIVGVDRAGRVEYRYAAFRGETAARAHLRFITNRKFEEQARGYERALEGFQLDWCFKKGAKVHAGGVGREKPFERVIDAVAELARPVFLLAFCTASDAEIERLRNYAAGKLNPGSFQLCPPAPREELRASLWEADIGVVDYTFSVEPTSNQRHCAPTKLYEFMAAGLAILGSNNDSLRDVIEREAIGCCARGDSPGDLARALGELLGRDSAKMKERAKTVFAEKYSYEMACEGEVRKIAGELRSKGRP